MVLLGGAAVVVCSRFLTTGGIDDGEDDHDASTSSSSSTTLIKKRINDEYVDTEAAMERTRMKAAALKAAGLKAESMTVFDREVKRAHRGQSGVFATKEERGEGKKNLRAAKVIFYSKKRRDECSIDWTTLSDRLNGY